MTSTEARAKWLHLANRGVVGEDYERASRPPSFIPSSSKSKSEKNSSDLPADTKWWLYQEHSVDTGNPPCETNPAFVQNDNVEIQELEAVIGDTLQKQPTLPEDDHKVDFSDETNKLFSELESQWIGIKKNEPWWRTPDLDDFVSLKSLEHFDNCDLLLPQTIETGWLVCENGLASLHQDPNKQKSSFTDSMPRSSASQYTSAVVGCSPCGLDRPVSATQSDEARNVETPNSELSNVQLLEAVFHSERRARETARAAQEAYNEKEHLITLCLKQASQMLAYKQWLYILKVSSQVSTNQFTPDFQILWYGPTHQKRVLRDIKCTSMLGSLYGVWLLLALVCYLVGTLVGYLLLLYDLHFYWLIRYSG